MMQSDKRGRGRKKIEIKKIERIQQLNVSFSKRRQGLFHKAEKLCILCGVQLAIIVFSPTGRLHTFGHPSVDFVMERFVNVAGFQSIQTGCSATGGGLELVGLLNAHELLDKSPEIESGAEILLDVAIESLGIQELESYKVSLEEMKRKVAMQTG